VTLAEGELTPAMFQIMLSLMGGERHGYSIMREIAQRTDGEVRLGAATLYRCIKRMVDTGLIVESAERPDPELDDERRRYYRLTDLGEHVARRHAQQLAKLVETAYRKKLLDAPAFTG
jgi:DNA-binding PadR family transcriptional regulator